jgi:hypothetical protein
MSQHVTFCHDMSNGVEIEVDRGRDRGRDDAAAVTIIGRVSSALTSLPTTSNPATASAIAESPSVSTSVHSDDLEVPA